MLASDPYPELRKGKNYNTNTDHEMRETGSNSSNVVGKSSENNGGEIAEFHALTQKMINEQKKGFTAPTPHVTSLGIDSTSSRDGVAADLWSLR